MLKHLPDDLPKRLRAAGLTVIEVDDWRENGRDSGDGPVGVLNHHTGSFDKIGDLADDLAYARWLFSKGRPDLAPPLCNIALSAEGTVYLGAKGRAYHGGMAKASGSVAAGDANYLYVGIEWMLSGTQVIPAGMMKAGATLNAVLTQWMGNSVQTVSCHYQTSVTGKWDIGDPNGVSFGSAKVLNVPKFRAAVQAERDRLVKPPKKPARKISFQHTSLQFSDTEAQMKADVEKIFSRGKQHLSGTESGADNPLMGLVKEAAEKHGYRLHLRKSVWVAVKKNLIKDGSRVTTGFVPVIESFEGAGRHSDRGIVWLTYTHKTLGRITIGCAHYLTNGRKPGDPNFVLNRRLAEAIGVWATEKGKGKAIVFYSGDQNIVDRTEDTFFGSPLTTAWDEIGKWENTGHGNIDVVASYDHDRRVKAVSITALDDSEFPLHTDHFLVDAVYKVREI
jgi:hypothetical protein